MDTPIFDELAARLSIVTRLGLEVHHLDTLNGPLPWTYNSIPVFTSTLVPDRTMYLLSNTAILSHNVAMKLTDLVLT